MKQSLDIIDIIADVTKETSKECVLTVSDGKGGFMEMPCPEINYIFGNARYVKDRLDAMSKSAKETGLKFPLIALFCPVNEQRDSSDYHSKARIRILIACSTKKAYSNEQRREISFVNILRPIYDRFIEALRNDKRLDFGYKETVSHDYSENYSYGRYGAYTDTGDEVSEVIDAINITNLELKVKNFNCRRQ